MKPFKRGTAVNFDVRAVEVHDAELLILKLPGGTAVNVGVGRAVEIQDAELSIKKNSQRGFGLEGGPRPHYDEGADELHTVGDVDEGGEHQAVEVGAEKRAKGRT